MNLRFKNIILAMVLIWGVQTDLTLPCQPTRLVLRRVRESGDSYAILSGEEREKMGFKKWYEVLLKDSAGRIYYVYRDVDKEDYERKIEKFVYALGKDIVNLCEIKTIGIRQVIGAELAKWMFDHRYTELVVSRLAQNYKLADLTQKKHSAEGLIVFYTLIRDFTPHYFVNSGDFDGLYIVENEYISYDHDKSLVEEDTLHDFAKMTPALVRWIARQLDEVEWEYSTIVDIALKFEKFSDADFKRIAEESGLGEYPIMADNALKFLVANRNSLMEDLIMLIKEVKGVDLRQYLPH